MQRLVGQCSDNAYKRVAVMESNTASNHNTQCMTSTSMHKVKVQQSLAMMSQDFNSTIRMLKAVEGFDSKNNVIPFKCLCLSFITPMPMQTPVVLSQQ